MARFIRPFSSPSPSELDWREALQEALCGCAVFVASADALTEAELDRLVDGARSLGKALGFAATTAQLMDWSRLAAGQLKSLGPEPLLQRLRTMLSHDFAHEAVRVASEVACADGPLDERERAALLLLAGGLGVAPREVEALVALASRGPRRGGEQGVRALTQLGWTRVANDDEVWLERSLISGARLHAVVDEEAGTVALQLTEGPHQSRWALFAVEAVEPFLRALHAAPPPATVRELAGFVDALSPQAAAVFELRGGVLRRW